ncbi:MAG TPA: DNA-3-methyladenine glycosylase [Actinomycetota bacterium]|nr:DNA-3-methyladenine glycosylase [Actinomycetota bacterium]
MTQIELPYRNPYPIAPVFSFLAARAVDGLERVEATTYRRTVRIGSEHGVVEIAADEQRAVFSVTTLGRKTHSHVVERCRAMFDLDADPVAISDALTTTPELAAVVRAVPGRRVVGSLDGFEMVIRALLGQQVSVAGARTVLGRLVARFGDPVRGGPGLTRAFPEPARLAEESLEEVRVPGIRRQAIRAVSRAVADGSLDLSPTSDRNEVRERLTSIPGIGPWTAAYVSMRALRDPDVFMATDLGVRKGAERLGLPASARDLSRVAESWRPWRSYATQYLWAAAA